MPKSQHLRVVILVVVRITFSSMSIDKKNGDYFSSPRCNDDDNDTVMMFIMAITTKIMTTMVDNDAAANDADNDNDSLLWQRSL